MDFLDRSDFDREAESFAKSNPRPEPEKKKKEDPIFPTEDPQMRDPSSGSSIGSGRISLKSSHSTAANIYGSTLGGDGIDPFG